MDETTGILNTRWRMLRTRAELAAAPDLVLHACAKLGVAPREAWMVGDSRFDRGAANAAQVRFVGLGLDGDDRVEQLAELGVRVEHAAR